MREWNWWKKDRRGEKKTLKKGNLFQHEHHSRFWCDFFFLSLPFCGFVAIAKGSTRKRIHFKHWWKVLCILKRLQSCCAPYACRISKWRWLFWSSGEWNFETESRFCKLIISIILKVLDSTNWLLSVHQITSNNVKILDDYSKCINKILMNSFLSFIYRRRLQKD